MPIKYLDIKQLKENAVIPKYQTSGASGFDLHSVEDICIMPGDTVAIPTGLAFNIPEGYEIQVRPRSGMSFKTKLRIANSPGTIDEDYTGEVKIIMDNIGTIPAFVKTGDRIAQAILCSVVQCTIRKVDELKETDRGQNGLGSTGV